MLYPTRIKLVLILITGLLNGITVQAATTYNWTNAAAASYNLTTAWTPNGLPGPVDTATVGNSASANGSVLYNNPAYAYGLNVLQLGQVGGSDGTFTMTAGALSITNNGGTGLAIGNAAGGTGASRKRGGNWPRAICGWWWPSPSATAAAAWPSPT